jgi:tetraacyldisaccharide 4'-kinase
MRRMDQWLSEKPETQWEESLMSGLHFASKVYTAGVRARAWAYRHGVFRRISVEAPLVSIGNVTVGGTGKTPLTIHLASQLLKLGRKPAIVSRGYLKQGRGFVVVSDGKRVLAGRRQAGDEAYMMARALPSVPVVVGPNRSVAATIAYGRFGPDIILMDDGFQHLKVQRDLDIVVIDSTDPFGNGITLPRGILREPPNHLRRADLLLLTRTNQTDSLPDLRRHLHELNPSAPIVESIHAPMSLRHHQLNTELGVESLAGSRVVALSSIGNPRAFESTLTGLGAELADKWRFPNHYGYRRGPLSDLVDRAADLNVSAIVTTEKDLVRFPAGFAFSVPVWILGVELQVTAGADHLAKVWHLGLDD